MEEDNRRSHAFRASYIGRQLGDLFDDFDFNDDDDDGPTPTHLPEDSTVDPRKVKMDSALTGSWEDFDLYIEAEETKPTQEQVLRRRSGALEKLFGSPLAGDVKKEAGNLDKFLPRVDKGKSTGNRSVGTASRDRTPTKSKSSVSSGGSTSGRRSQPHESGSSGRSGRSIDIGSPVSNSTRRGGRRPDPSPSKDRRTLSRDGQGVSSPVLSTSQDRRVLSREGQGVSSPVLSSSQSPKPGRSLKSTRHSVPSPRSTAPPPAPKISPEFSPRSRATRGSEKNSPRPSGRRTLGRTSNNHDTTKVQAGGDEVGEEISSPSRRIPSFAESLTTLSLQDSPEKSDDTRSQALHEGKRQQGSTAVRRYRSPSSRGARQAATRRRIASLNDSSGALELDKNRNSQSETSVDDDKKARKVRSQSAPRKMRTWTGRSRFAAEDRESALQSIHRSETLDHHKGSSHGERRHRVDSAPVPVQRSASHESKSETHKDDDHTHKDSSSASRKKRSSRHSDNNEELHQSHHGSGSKSSEIEHTHKVDTHADIRRATRNAIRSKSPASRAMSMGTTGTVSTSRSPRPNRRPRRNGTLTADLKDSKHDHPLKKTVASHISRNSPLGSRRKVRSSSPSKRTQSVQKILSPHV